MLTEVDDEFPEEEGISSNNSSTVELLGKEQPSATTQPVTTLQPAIFDQQTATTTLQPDTTPTEPVPVIFPTLLFSALNSFSIKKVEKVYREMNYNRYKFKGLMLTWMFILF